MNGKKSPLKFAQARQSTPISVLPYRQWSSESRGNSAWEPCLSLGSCVSRICIVWLVLIYVMLWLRMLDGWKWR